jgi:serine phosphatase RsbU (regulator of sigma subunit)/tetratricopeptide (TPR) repeat protein
MFANLYHTAYFLKPLFHQQIRAFKPFFAFFLLFATLFLQPKIIFAQGQMQIDSLRQVVTTLPADSSRIAPLITLARALSNTFPKQSLQYSTEAVQLAQKANLETPLATALRTQGNVYMNLSKYDSSMQCYISSLKICEKQGDKLGTAACLMNIGNIYTKSLKDYEQSLVYYNKSLAIMEELGDEKRMARVYNNIGLVYIEKKEIAEALKYFDKALAIHKKLKDGGSIASLQNSIGDAYKAKKDYLQAVYFYTQSLNGAKETADRLLLVENFNSIGEIYYLQGQFKQSVPFLQQGLAMAKDVGTKDQIESFYRKLATAHEALKDTLKAYRYFKMAAAYKDSIHAEQGSEQMAKMLSSLQSDNQKKEIALLNAQNEQRKLQNYISFGGIGLAIIVIVSGIFSLYNIRKKNNLLQEQNDEINAQKEEITQQKDVLEVQSRDLMLANTQILKQKEEVEEKGRSLEMANRLVLKQKEEVEEKGKSLEAANSEIMNQRNQLSDTLEDVKMLSRIGQELTSSLDFETTFMRLYEYIKDIMDLDCFRVMIVNEQDNVLEDTYCIENGNRLQAEVINMDDPTRLSVICTRNKKDIFISDYVNEFELYFPNTCLLSTDNIPLSIIYLPLLIDEKVKGVISVQSYRKNAFDEFDLNVLKNLAVYTAISLDNARAYGQIRYQSKVIEEKNKSITDSLRYAETMQQSMLPSEKLLTKLFAEYFVIFQPKDYVSGDFYWCATVEDKTFIAVVDCTGHGVPGAFMSLIGNSLLNEIVKHRHIISPALVLENLHTGVQNALQQENKINDDGMDVCLCSVERISPVDMMVVFAGAKRPLLYKRQKDTHITRIKGDSKAIGGWFKGKTGAFVDNELMLRKGDVVYLMSDGYPDQDNPEREKFGIEKLTNLLETSQHLSMKEQKMVLQGELTNFKRNRSQRDDISMVGIRL